MNVAYEGLRLVEDIVFAGLGLAALTVWIRRRSHQGGWLAATFGALALMAVTGRLVTAFPDSDLRETLQRIQILLLAAYPYFLYRFTASFSPPHRERNAAALGLATFTGLSIFLFRDIPETLSTRTLTFEAWALLLTAEWVLFSAWVATELWRTGRGQPGASRRRMRTLSIGSVLLSASVVLSTIVPGEESEVTRVIIRMIAISSALVFALGFAPPAIVRTYWRRDEEARLHNDQARLMTAETPDDVAEIILPSATALVSGSSAILEMSGERRWTFPPDAQPRAEGREDQLTVPLKDGSLSVTPSAYTPFFGREETHLLARLGVLTDLAIARTDALERERIKAKYLHVLNTVSFAANSAASIEEILRVAIDCVCESMQWPLGHAYIARDRPDVLVPTKIWHVEDPERFAEFISVTDALQIPSTKGLSAPALTSSKPQWYADLSQETTFERGRYLEESVIASAAVVPVNVRDTIVATFEFFSDRPRKRDEVAIEVMTEIGSQIARVFEREQAARQISERAEQLARSNADLEQFAYIASHDLQEPLRMVNSYLTLLKERLGDALDETGTKYIDFAIDGASRMQSLIQDLLMYSRVGTRVKDLEETDLDDVLDEVLSDLAVVIEESGAQITREDLPTAPVDAQQMSQLFQNLITNALKFKGSETPRVHIGATQKRRGWEISVADNGIGIDPNYFDRIFTIFQRLHTRSEYSGTGIGLAVCKKIVERHGGRIWVESEPGKGATFRFTIDTSIF